MSAIGWIVSVGMAVAFVVALVAATISLVGEAIGRIERRGEIRGQEWASKRLMTASWWFSEDDATQQLLADLAHANLEAWEARDKWRKRQETQG
jgi:hypothetical protein